jgi:hypothetical protein
MEHQQLPAAVKMEPIHVKWRIPMLLSQPGGELLDDAPNDVLDFSDLEKGLIGTRVGN